MNLTFARQPSQTNPSAGVARLARHSWQTSGYRKLKNALPQPGAVWEEIVMAVAASYADRKTRNASETFCLSAPSCKTIAQTAAADNPNFNRAAVLAFDARLSACLQMGLPSQPITLSVEQLGDLNRKLSAMRHDINNNLSLIVAAAELIRHKPAMAEKMIVTMAEQPAKIMETIRKFSAEFEQTFGITKP